jgi:stress response protein SCP2
MESDDNYQVFISYRNLPDDLRLAREVVKALSKRGVKVFFSDKSIAEAGRSDWRGVIDLALQQARVMVVVAALPDHLHSGWVLHEWQTFSTEIVSGRKPGGEIYTYCAGMTVEKLPIALRSHQMYMADRQGLAGMAGAVGNALLRRLAVEPQFGVAGQLQAHGGNEPNPYTPLELAHVPRLKPGGVMPLALLDLAPRFLLSAVCAVPDSRFDVEVAAFMLQHSHVVDSERDVVYFNERQHFSGAVSLEERSPETPFLQRMSIDLGQVPGYVHRIAFVAFLYEAAHPMVNFANSQGVAFWIGNSPTATPRLALDPTTRFNLESTGVRLVDFFRAPADMRNWNIQARCAPLANGFAGACDIFEVP